MKPERVRTGGGGGGGGGGGCGVLLVVRRNVVWYISMAYLPLGVLFLAKVSCFLLH